MSVKKIFNIDGFMFSFRLFFVITISLAYSIMLTIGPMVEAQSIEITLSLLPSFILRFIICLLVNFFFLTVLPQLRLYARAERMSRYLEKFRNYRYFFLVVWVFIFLAWIPAYLIFYPGILTYDIASQTISALGTITNNHHPILHTWLIRVFLKLGMSLFSSYESGLGFFSYLQMLILSYSLARLICLLKNKGVHMLIVMVTTLLSAVWITNACFSISIVKDSLHAAFLVLFSCHFTEIVSEPAEYILHRKNLIFFPIISFLMCAFRNNGIHIYIFCFTLLLVLKFTQIIKVLTHVKKVFAHISIIIAVVLPIVMYSIYTGPVFKVLDIEKGEVREALSVPIQQMQRVAINKADELTEEQTYLMCQYITDLSWRSWSPGRVYDPFFADPAKSCFHSAYYEADPIAFWKFYLQIGKQYSKEYIIAFLSNTLGFWYPNFMRFSYIECNNHTPEYFMENSAEPLVRKSIWNSQVLTDYYESVCYSDSWRQIPVIRLFLLPGFTLWFLLYGLALSFRKREFFRKTLPVFLPLIGQYGIMLLSPMSSYRYAWPFYLMLPLVFIGANPFFIKSPSPTAEGRINETHD